MADIYQFKNLGDGRGSLVSLESNKNLPFNIKRVYYMYGCTPTKPRGFHAHRELQQIAIAISGSCRILLDDGITKKWLQLNSPEQGVHIGNMVWHEMHDFSDDCILMVLADDFYDEADYIRDYDQFTNSMRGVI